MDERLHQLTQWAHQFVSSQGYLAGSGLLIPVSEDASFRRYYRLAGSDCGCVFVDAPPAQEDMKSFVRIAELLTQAKVQVGKVRAKDLESGFLAIDDLGDTLLLEDLHANKKLVRARLGQASLEILKMQLITKSVPAYTRRLLQEEMELFPHWFLSMQLQLEISTEWQELFSGVTAMLIESAVKQPQTFVHRDFHSRNIMLTGQNSMAVIDYQDAVIGPITYDLVSLLKDCYFRLERADVIYLAKANWELLRDRYPADLDSFPEFLRWFDLMGLQRHLKCAGIFCRLHLRDGKPGYLADVPLVLDYILEVCELYDPLQGFGSFLRDNVSFLVKDKLL